MLLNKNQFDQKFKNNKLRLAFIGMSNIGKSFRSEELKKEKGFLCKSIDDDINKKLNHKTEEDTAKWLNFPYSAGFAKRQKKYLQIEDSLTKKIQIPKNKNFLLDTTGSAIYLDKTTHEFLQNNFFIIHFEVPNNLLNKIMGEYFARPKPIIWGDIFDQKKDESKIDSLKRCYPKLLAFRSKKYRVLADISINFFRESPMPHQEFWELLRSSLKK